MRVHVCGVRGATPAPGAEFVRYGGHTSCLALASDRGDAPDLILDAGTGLRMVTALLGGRPFVGTLLLTHMHWDHFQGLPFFGGGDREGSRVRLVLPDQGNGEQAESLLCRAMSPPLFPIAPGELRGSWQFELAVPGELRIGPYTVLAREIPHKGGRTFGYRVSDGHVVLAYMPDHCPTALGPGPDGLGEYHPAALELADRADLLVHDAQLYGREELACEGSFGHAAAEYAIELGCRAGAARVLLFHHRADRTDQQLDELSRRLAHEPRVVTAAQGQVLELSSGRPRRAAPL